jgi:predicted DNA-binding transcriptional regulator YafY
MINQCVIIYGMDNRKNLPRTALARIYYIDSQIAAGKYPNAGQLAKGYETSMATIHRDIDYMRCALNAPIEYNAEHRGFYYAKKTFRLPARYASAGDMMALGMAKSILRLYKGTPLYESAKRLLDEITAPLSQGDSDSTRKEPWFEKRLVVPPVATAPVKPELWQVIVDALRENRVMAFEYRGIDDAQYKSRLMRPYQLLFQDGMWYIYGYSEEKKELRTFSLSRIENAALTNETFKLPPDYDFFAKHDGSYFGLYIGKEQNFKIWFSGVSSRFIEERQWAANQTIERAKDGDGIILSFKSAQLSKVLWWVLSYGSNARPLKPSILVEKWKNEIKAMGRNI